MSAPLKTHRLKLVFGHREMVLALSYIALVIIFVLRGNFSQTDVMGHSAFRWMTARWRDTLSYGGVDYSHGWLIPFVSLWLVWRRRNDIVSTPKSVEPIALIPLVAGLCIHYAGLQVAQTRISLFAFIVVAWSLPFYLYGRVVGGALLFPAAYLIFCIPLNFLNSFTFPLRLLATMISAGLLNGLNIACIRSGTRILLTAGGGCALDVADPCSGLRSLLAIGAIAAAYGYVALDRNWKKWALFVLAVPLAIIGNVARIVTVSIIAAAFGSELALDLYHDYSGYFVFVVVVLTMMGIARVLSHPPLLRPVKPAPDKSGNPEASP